jgi:hypothetical protein
MQMDAPADQFPAWKNAWAGFLRGGSGRHRMPSPRPPQGVESDRGLRRDHRRSDRTGSQDNYGPKAPDVIAVRVFLTDA